VQVTGNVAMIADWLELVKTVLSVTKWGIASTKKKLNRRNKDLEMQN